MSESAYKSAQASVVSYLGVKPILPASVFLADGARVIGDVVLGEACSVWFNAVVRGDVNSIRIGFDTNIQDNAVIHCSYKTFPTVIGNRVSIAHLAMVHGCEIQDDCLIGMGSVILDGACIGQGSIVAAHSLVTKGMQIPKRSLVMGSPAKVIKEVSDEQLKDIMTITQRYKEYTKGFG